MIHLEKPPSPPLAPFVECYWYVCASAEEEYPGPLKVLPTESVNLIFNLGHPHRAYHPGDFNQWELNQRCWISGIRKESMFIGPTHGTHVAGIRFRPGGLPLLLQTPASEFHMQTVEMEDVWGDLGEKVCEQLHDAESTDAKFAVLERFLLRRCRGNLEADPRVGYAVRWLTRNPLASPLDICESLGISHKHLTRLFRRDIGITPRALTRLQRFQRVIGRLEVEPPADWAPFALDCGYYDQSHFINDFRAYSGLTPSAYLQKRTPFRNFVHP